LSRSNASFSFREEIRQQNKKLAIERERQRYQDLFEFAPDGYLLTDAVGTIQAANQAAATLLSVSEARLVGESLIDYIAEPDR
jgi:PAS domain S-box-containing protein